MHLHGVKVEILSGKSVQKFQDDKCFLVLMIATLAFFNFTGFESYKDRDSLFSRQYFDTVGFGTRNVPRVSYGFKSASVQPGMKSIKSLDDKVLDCVLAMLSFSAYICNMLQLCVWFPSLRPHMIYPFFSEIAGMLLSLCISVLNMIHNLFLVGWIIKRMAINAVPVCVWTRYVCVHSSWTTQRMLMMLHLPSSNARCHCWILRTVKPLQPLLEYTVSSQ